MNILTVSILSSCNILCYYCPVRKWLVPPAPPGADRKGVNLITNEVLLKWLDAYMEPNKWIIEITGGEPGLYPEINTLVTALDGRGYTGLVKTNGSLPIPKTKGIKLIAAWHKGQNFPAYYDEIVIIKNPDDNWKDKVTYCKDNGITYHTVLFDRVGEGKRIEKEYCRHNKIISICHINSSGQITRCSRDPVNLQHTIFNMTPPQTKDVIHECPACKNINDVEMFLDQDTKARIEADFEKLKMSFT